MYEYRQLSRELQRRLVNDRRASALPLHELSHRVNDGNLYLLIGTNYEHRHVMSTPERRDEFSEKLLTKFRDLPNAELFAWCLLPNHYHLLARVDQDDFAAMSARLHNGTSTQWNREDGMPGRKVWYRYCDRDIRNDRHFWVAMNYIHANAVKHGYVKRAYDWPWSSVHFYAEIWGKEALRELWRDYPVRNFGDKWDY
jgi:putative transposase